jgi:hypothetical protein
MDHEVDVAAVEVVPDAGLGLDAPAALGAAGVDGLAREPDRMRAAVDELLAIVDRDTGDGDVDAVRDEGVALLALLGGET